MIKLFKKPVFSALLFAVSCNIFSNANATLIDLNDFYSDPSVTVSTDGTEATIFEDSFLGISFLSLDPFLGDPDVIIPGLNVFLTFDFNFIEAANEEDEFSYALFDSDTRDDIVFENFLESESGSVSLDLTGLIGARLGLYFGLTSYDSDLNSLVTISNLSLNTVTTPTTPPNSSIPEPATFSASLAALLCFFSTRKKLFKRK